MKKTVLAIAFILFSLCGSSLFLTTITSGQASRSKGAEQLRADKYNPIWSKDGKQISFCNEYTPGKFKIYFVKPDGSRIRDFGGRGSAITDISVNNRILFYARTGPNDDDNEIFSINMDGTGLKQLTNNSSIDLFASWSSDLSRIAFATSRDGQFEIYVMNADGSGQVNLSKTPKANDFSRPPAWSPDDQWILFSSNMDGDNEIYKIHPDGTGLQKMTDNQLTDFHPSFSPDGKFIAFISNRRGTKDELDNRIYVMNADGTNQHQVGNISPIHGSVSWSPKGDQLTFNAFSHYVVEIFTIATDGTNLRQLTFSPAQPLLETLKNKGVEAAQKLFAERKQKGAPDDLFYTASMRRLGNEYLSQKAYAEAVAAFTFLTEVDPGDATFWNRLGEAYKESGDRENAIRSLKQSLALNPLPAVKDRSLKLLNELGVKD